jgi:hypothetical protein
MIHVFHNTHNIPHILYLCQAGIHTKKAILFIYIQIKIHYNNSNNN